MSTSYYEYLELKNTLNKLRKNKAENAELIRLYDKLRKKLERGSRCVINGKRCKKKCSECERSRGGNEIPLEDLDKVGSIHNSAPSPEDLLEKQELYRRLHLAIGELNKVDRVIVQLFSLGFTEREIGVLIGKSQKTVNNHKHKAFSVLREKMEFFV